MHKISKGEKNRQVGRLLYAGPGDHPALDVVLSQVSEP